MLGDWDPVDVTLECVPGGEYDEGAFRYFVSVERSRADRSNCLLRLLLVTMEPVHGKPVPMERTVATRLFAALRASLRETDVMGWYLQDRVAGVVLNTCTVAAGPEASPVIEQRVDEGLRRQLPSAIADNVRIRVVQLRALTGNR